MLISVFDRLPPGMTMFFGALYVIMPIMPEPHLVQKAMMLRDGFPLAPLDWFDIVVHSAAGLLAVAMFLRQRHLQSAALKPSQGDDA
ncbi:MAG: hypothetical protein JKY27_02865 [Magnetovibrio sp.]|nr:hypothetical protein [Magnetovibrio sp.]